jgi:hypothetical protein
MIHYKQNKVSRAIWPWTKGNTEGTSSFPVSALPALFIGGSATALFFYTGHSIPAAVVGIISVLLFCSALVLPQVYGKIRFFFSTFSWYVGQGISWLLLVPFFYLFFPVGRLIQKISGKDPMSREFPSTLSSYWLDKKDTDDLQQYRRQF